MAKTKGKVTSRRVAKIASKLLRSKRTSPPAKAAAGSALAQAPKRRRKRKGR